MYSETRKTQSILRSNTENLNRLIDDEHDSEELDTEDDFSQRRISNNKKIRLVVKRKKSIVNDRTKLLRKNRNDEFRPIMINQFFLSAMHNDNQMLSDLYEKMHLTLSTTNSETLSDFDSTVNVLSPSSMSDMKSSQIVPMRSRTNSLSSNASILTNAVHLLTENSDEYSYLDSSKVNAFINETQNPMKIDEQTNSPAKIARKRRLTIEYPFPFLVEQVKKQRMSSKKLLEANREFLRPLSPEYVYPILTKSIESVNDIVIQTTPPSIHSKRQRSTTDFRHLQTNMHRILFEQLKTSGQPLDFSELSFHMNENEHRSDSSTDIAIYFAALLNNAVKYQLKLQSNDLRDDIQIYAPNIM